MPDAASSATPPPRSLSRWIVLGVASAGFVGFLPYNIVPHKKWKGSGLLGSLVGWGLLWCLPAHGTFFTAAFILMLALSIAASHWAEKWLTYDDPRIVIDEVIGVWTACFGLDHALAPMLWGLVLFRVFDVFKGPWGRAAARLPGGLGVVADDLAAGLIARALLFAFLRR